MVCDGHLVTVNELTEQNNRLAGQVRALTERCTYLENLLQTSHPEAKRLAPEKNVSSMVNFHQMYEASLDAFCHTDGDGVILECNSVFYTLFGKEGSEIFEKSLFDFFIEIGVWNRKRIRQVLNEQGMTPLLTMEVIRNDGSRLPVEFRAWQIRDAVGKPMAIYAFIRDISERLQLEKTIQQSKKRLQMVVDTMPALIAYVDSEERLVCCNTEYAKWFGVSPKTVRGKKISEVLGKQVYQQIAAHVQKALAGIPHELEVTLQHRELGERINHLRLTSNCDDQGRVYGFVMLSTDITEQKVYLQQLEEQANLFKAFTTYVPEGIVIADTPDVQIRMVSDFGCQMTGRDYKSLVHIGVENHPERWRIFLPDGKTLMQADKLPLSRAVLEGEEIYNEELLLERQDGKMIPVLCNAGPIRDAAGIITGGIIAWRDISELKERDEKLNRLYRILEETSDMVALTSIDGWVIYCNPAMRQILGLRENDSLGYGTIQINQPEWVRELIREKGIPEAVRKGSWRQRTAVIAADNGQEIPVSQILIAHKDSSDQVIHFSTIFRDISRTVQQEKRAQKALRQLAVVNQELQQFSYVCSHDLAEPLRSISGFLELFSRRYGKELDDKANELISQAKKGAMRLDQLLTDLYRYIHVDKKDVHHEDVDMKVVVDEVSQTLHQKISRQQATIHCRKLPVLKAKRSLMVLLVQNLISNALKFCRDEPPQIEVSAYRQDAEWIVSIRDNGIGIDPRFKDRIFIVFQRLHRREEYPGTGIGLAVCQKIVRKHGGRIWFESEPNQGTTFYFAIPYRENTNQQRTDGGQKAYFNRG